MERESSGFSLFRRYLLVLTGSSLRNLEPWYTMVQTLTVPSSSFSLNVKIRILNVPAALFTVQDAE